MSCNRGPRVKQMRAVGTDLPGLSRKNISRKPFPPGLQEGQFRKKKSEYGTQLLEKQKLRFNYGISEKYLRKLVLKAFRSKENSGHKLIELLESRLDNVVFKAGYAPTISAARQLITHKHVLIDGKRVNIPSYQTKTGQSISTTEKAAKLDIVKNSIEQPAFVRPAWLSFDKESDKTKVITSPDRDSIGFSLEIPLIVEFYSRSIK
jgi:small subunit ribosomal protein S4